MSFKMDLDLDTSKADEKIDKTQDKIDKTLDSATEMVARVKEKTTESFNEVLGMMRASYMMISGLSQALGGGLSQVFSSMFSVAISAIATYKAIAAAMAASGVGAIQAVVMFSSLITAITTLATAMEGETEFSKRLTGLNTTLHGISSIIGSLNFL